MSELTHLERIKLEKLLEMGSGFVLNFSNKTFRDFVFERLGIDIYLDKYNINGESKANRLRTFWEQESNYIVATLLFAMLEYFSEVVIPNEGWSQERKELYENGYRIAERLKGELGEHIEAIETDSKDKDFEKLGKSIRQLIHENKPEEAIDRLHTYFAMFIHQLCDKHGIQYEKNKTTNSLMGEYIKHIQNKGLLETVMAEKILKYSINIVDAFNEVRNSKSLAHPNPLLGYEESLLIFRIVSSVVAFINSIEGKYPVIVPDATLNDPDELPF